MPRPRRRRSVAHVNLGCPKNQLDGDVMLGLLVEAGWRVVPEDDRPDLILVNTCSFIIEGPGAREGYPLLGRARDMAPEVDGVVHLAGEARAGGIVPARVTAALEYDLLAVVEKP